MNRNLEDLNPIMEKRVRKWLELCEVNGLNVLITEGLRTLNRQRFLYAFGRFGINRTKAKRTWTMDSNHLTGMAIDFCFKDGNKITYKGDWGLAYDLAEKVGLKSLFRKYHTDKPHLDYDIDWTVENQKYLEQNEAILEKKMEKAWKVLDDANSVKKYIAHLKEKKFIPYKII